MLIVIGCFLCFAPVACSAKWYSAADADSEPLRAAFDAAVSAYVADHYPQGFSAVYAKGDSVVICVEDHKFQPSNYWNGRWRAEWTCVFRLLLLGWG